ncbi:hypothetical protein AIOL_001458 [Candidatus Rhodobacter oscarellae]|uniref:Lysozyme inhibitor LprI-like N-terminal domain-containing protein n=2 Tax=Candidatus Rhodobacter oscarellae TaxID=1675527 RepID=A0A0J9E3T3_9RHOB|nr:hypothetical protein AIOL_001458 [Candidatus Rhodobacter lobularis]
MYRELRAQERREDASGGTPKGAPRQADLLRDMQRAWITFRDRTCDYERAQWGGGTGGGPAYTNCLMVQTAKQTIYLEQAMGYN